MDDSLRRRLSEIRGAIVDPRAATISPGSVDDVAAICRACSETGTPLAVCSGPPGGRSAADASLLVSLQRLDSVDVAPERLVARAGAGADVTALLGAAQRVGLRLCSPPSSPAGTVGSLVARGGLARRALTGIEAVLSNGDHVHSGGQVLKDVAGYDLAGVLLGSAGRLAVIVAVTVRLLPANAPVEAADADGVHAPGALGDLLRAAFDPQGLLRPAPSG